MTVCLNFDMDMILLFIEKLIKQNSFEYKGIENVLCGKEFFTSKRIIVIENEIKKNRKINQ
ncbi:hypothetical protein KM1_018870 [Entamoeba histolytica HM-3:IMSS]|uniref:Uncharacterized protein n=1 Tax=Entamoeba histolytica HM-3:IMSS TaxID=885315 RepID=M7W9E5_ENTHI|nr:hypothetical protein KM1_018870 [Entamoeba histolytica HM-3:IMSS]